MSQTADHLAHYFLYVFPQFYQLSMLSLPAARYQYIARK